MKIKNDKLFIQIACLICSVVLWVIVMIQTNPLQDKPITNVHVNIKNLQALENSNMVLMNSDKDNLTVNVKVRGYADNLTKINKSDITAYIDVLGFQEGTRYAKVEILGPSGVEIAEVFPSQIACVVESVVSRVMDVNVKYEGKQAADYYRTGGISNPSSIKITGPRSVVNSVQSAVATINLDGATDTVVKTVPVRIYDGTDTEIFMTTPIENVQVSVPVYPTKYVEIKPTIVGEPLEGYTVTSVTVKPERVKIAARKDILDSVKELVIEELDITDTYHNIMSSKEVMNDNGLIMVDMPVAPVVNVVVEKITEKVLSFTLKDIEFINLKDGYKVATNDEEVITATLKGPASLVNSFIKTDMKLVADLSNVVPGVNNVSIEHSSDKDIKDIIMSSSAINIEIVESAETEE